MVLEQRTFFQFVAESVQAHSSLLCVGLDPREGDATSARDACFRLIESTAEYAAAFKANIAFFEALGAEGLAALREVIARVPHGTPVILDAKRGDIADTSEAYARAAFETLGADAVTVNPYLGGEALTPFLARRERGVFVLCKTSNPGADEFQSLRIDNPAGETPGEKRPLFEVVAEHARRWNKNGNVGLVVAATDAEALARVRALAPDLWLLVPGIGAQSGDLRNTLEKGLNGDGDGLLINVSRSIALAADPRAEAKRLRDEINQYRFQAVISPHPRPLSHPLPGSGEGAGGGDLQSLAHDLIASGCVRFGEFQLKSGKTSPIYLDLRRLVSHPEVLRRVGKLYADVLGELEFDRLAGIPYAGLPIATAVALEINRPLIYPRREAKTYGTKVEIEGEHNHGESVAVIDDLATTGGTKIESIRKLEAAGLRVRDIVVLIDRGEGAGEMLAAAGYRLHAVVGLRQLLDEWQQSGAVTPEQFKQVKRFLEER